MYKSLGGGFIALALITGTLAATTVANVLPASAADVGVSFNLGDVAFGYNDGYWDKSHTWHTWQQPSHRDAYRKSAGNQYHEWAHTRDADQGWHEAEHADHK